MSTSSPTGVLSVDGIAMVPDSEWKWDEGSKEFSVGYKPILFKGTGVVFHPDLSFGTAAARVNKPLTSSTIAYWEIRVPHPLFGTSIMFGIGTKDARTTLPISFNDLLGEDDCSIGLNHNGKLLFSGEKFDFCDPLSSGKPEGVTLGVLFNGPQASLTFFNDGIKLGTVSPKLDLSQTYYPMVASTAQRSHFYIVRQLVAPPICPTLFESAVKRVARMVVCDEAVNYLPVPTNIKHSLYQQMRLIHIHNGYSSNSYDLDSDCVL
uniref:B30.2/SPRY domain-containing protein n=1 Tax=Steinernema glaseri TaxID=37863 RepID=A0A1I8AP82_9BILA